jgi:hypothetical protein
MAIHELTTTTTTTAVLERPSGSHTDTLARLGAASGLFGFVLAIGAIVVSASTGTAAANPGASMGEIARAYANVPSHLVWVGAYLQVLALLLLFGFTSYVGVVLSQASSASSKWLATAATDAGQGFVLVTLVGFAIGGAARFRAGPGLDMSVAMALFDVHVAIYVVSWALSVVFLGAAAMVGLRTRALPGWLSIAAALVAVINMAAVALPTTPLAAFPNLLMWLWTLAASIALAVRASRRTSR